MTQDRGTHPSIQIIHAYDFSTRTAHMGLRWEVFVCEQNVPMVLEIDARDFDPDVIHLSAFSNSADSVPDICPQAVVGTVRIIPDEPGHYHLGRLAVRHDYRGRGIGRLLVEAAHKELKSRTQSGEKITVILAAQVHARGFYQSLGYAALSEETFMEAGIEHVHMSIMLEGRATG